MDVDRHLVRIDQREVRLTAKEFLLLQYLMQHRGRVLSRDLLLSDVWGYSYTGGTRTVDVHVRRLREKVPFLTDAIVTVKQFGYKLVEPAPDRLQLVRSYYRLTIFFSILGAAAVALLFVTMTTADPLVARKPHRSS